MHLTRINRADVLGTLGPDPGHLSEIRDLDPVRLQNLIKRVCGRLGAALIKNPGRTRKDGRIEAPVDPADCTESIALVAGPPLLYPRWILEVRGHYLQDRLVTETFAPDLDAAEAQELFNTKDMLRSFSIAKVVPVELETTLRSLVLV